MRLYILLLALLAISCTVSAEDTKFEGRALQSFERIGAWGWYVSVDRVMDGPKDMLGQNISVYLTSANPEEYPPGSIDPEINIGDNVSVFGQLQTSEPGSYHVLLVGSDEYYIRLRS
jgi:hypothetical protein